MVSATSDPSPDLRSRFEALVVPHLDRLLAFAIRRSDSVADAEDAVQEAFVRAWLGFADLRDDALARPWIYRILRTVISDFREKNGRRQQLVFITRLEDAHDELIGGEHDALFSEVVARLDSEAIHRALLKIPEDFATAAGSCLPAPSWPSAVQRRSSRTRTRSPSGARAAEVRDERRAERPHLPCLSRRRGSARIAARSAARAARRVRRPRAPSRDHRAD